MIKNVWLINIIISAKKEVRRKQTNRKTHSRKKCNWKVGHNTKAHSWWNARKNECISVRSRITTATKIVTHLFSIYSFSIYSVWFFLCCDAHFFDHLSVDIFSAYAANTSHREFVMLKHETKRTGKNPETIFRTSNSKANAHTHTHTFNLNFYLTWRMVGRGQKGAEMLIIIYYYSFRYIKWHLLTLYLNSINPKSIHFLFTKAFNIFLVFHMFARASFQTNNFKTFCQLRILSLEPWKIQILRNTNTKKQN